MHWDLGSCVLGLMQNYKVMYGFYTLWKINAFNADGGDKPKVKHMVNIPIPLTGKEDTIHFIFCVMYLPAKTFFTALFSLRFSHKSYGYKEMWCSDFKVAPLTEYFCELRTSLRAIQSRSENTTSQNSALACTWRHCNVECSIHLAHNDSITIRDVLVTTQTSGRWIQNRFLSTVMAWKKKTDTVRTTLLLLRY